MSCVAFRRHARLILFLLCLSLCPAILRADQIIYDDARQNGWQDWGWATLNYANTSPVHAGADSISATFAGTWQGLQLYHADQDSSLFASLNFWINGGASGGQKLQIYGLQHVGSVNNASSSLTYSLGTLSANTWQQFIVPLTALGITNQSNFTGFVIQDAIGAVQPTFYVDDISLIAAVVTPGTNALVTIQVDTLTNRHAISPLIYGVAFASSSQLLDLNAPLHRSGGNGTTTYNWQNNAWNHAADWYFESIAETSSAVGGDGDDFITTSKNGGAQPMLTIPTLGWVAKLGSNRSSLASYSTNKYGPQTANDYWFSTAGNGVSLATGLNITNNDPNDANLPSGTNYQAGWVQHLTNTWHSATNGGLRYYLMDNEWSLWQETHRDVHPVGATMQEELGKFCDYSTMVKGIDPDALVLGPEEWGWPGYLNSGYDLQVSGGHDRAANGGQDFSPWFLSQVQQRSLAAGKRLLDVFTLHIYPAESNLFGDAVDTATQLMRNQSTRCFWDTNYVDPSWINSIIKLIPRMKNWVTNYPGTKIGITEYNWGAEGHINGATAQADIYGIFGREGLDLATRWTTPNTGTPTYNAMKIYRNYDGNKSTFGDTSILAAVPNPDILAAFGAVRTSDGALTLMVINKDPNNATPITASLGHFAAAGTVQRWQLTSANVITQLASLTLTNGVISNTVPAQSITLFVVPPAAPKMRIASPDVSGQANLWLDGVAGVQYVIQSSTNLTAWAPFSTNTLVTNSAAIPISTRNTTRLFFRALK